MMHRLWVFDSDSLQTRTKETNHSHQADECEELVDNCATWSILRKTSMIQFMNSQYYLIKRLQTSIRRPKNSTLVLTRLALHDGILNWLNMNWRWHDTSISELILNRLKMTRRWYNTLINEILNKILLTKCRIITTILLRHVRYWLHSAH